MHGHDNVVQTLLANQANIDMQDNNGNTALIHAAMHGHDNVVQTLLTNRANINAQDNNGNTALIHAAMSEYDNVVKTLLHNGAKYIDTYNKQHNKQLLQKIAQYESHQVKQTTTCFVLALLPSLAIYIIGALAVCGISCPLGICLAIAIVNCATSSGFMAVLCKQNTKRQNISTQNSCSNISQADNTYPYRFLAGLISIAPVAFVVLQMSAVLCPPLLLVAISIMSIILSGNSFRNSIPNKISERVTTSSMR